MGGSGSGRWGSHRKRTTVEESLDLTMRPFIEALRLGPGTAGTVTWTRKSDGTKTASIGYALEPSGEGLALRFHYTADGIPQDYPVRVASAPMPRGGKRWFFLCPDCGRKASKLYKKPGRARFACRTCLGLTYESCQESHRFDSLFSSIAKNVGEGLSPKDVERILKQGTK